MSVDNTVVRDALSTGSSTVDGKVGGKKKDPVNGMIN
jgi:hypothetical protein